MNGITWFDLHVIHTLAHTAGVYEASLPSGTDYTGDIRYFSEIGPGGPVDVRPRPWVCDINGDGSSAKWQTPDGSIVPTAPSSPIDNQLTGSELYTTFEDGSPLDRLRLFRGPLYNSPEGEYCCVLTATNERRCVTLSECIDAFLSNIWRQNKLSVSHTAQQ